MQQAIETFWLHMEYLYCETLWSDSALPEYSPPFSLQATQPPDKPQSLPQTESDLPQTSQDYKQTRVSWHVIPRLTSNDLTDTWGETWPEAAPNTLNLLMLHGVSHSLTCLRSLKTITRLNPIYMSCQDSPMDTWAKLEARLRLRFHSIPSLPREMAAWIGNIIILPHHFTLA